MHKPLKGEDQLAELLRIGLTDEAARRMLAVARDYGLVNFPIYPKGKVGQRGTVELFGLTYADGMFTLGDADFSSTKR